MKILYLFSILFVLFIAGCQVNQVKQSSFDVTTSDKGVKKTVPDVIPLEREIEKETLFIFNPAKNEQFVFNEQAESLQKYGFDKFCLDTESFNCYSNRLPYDKYVGMKGYFETEKPAKTDYSGNEFYPVILENGDQFYFVSNNKYGGKYGGSSPIVPLKQYQEVKSFSKEPLVMGSSIELVSVKVINGYKYFKLNTGDTLSDEDLKLIREVSGKYGNKPEMAELLLDMNIDKDEVDYRFFIMPKGSVLRSEAKLYIGFNDRKKWLRFKVEYYDNDWLFVNSYKVAADDYRWQSPKMDFERDHSSGSVWEWSDLAASEKHIEVAKALANSKKSIIRFQGDQYYSDKLIQDDQKEGINNILKLFKLMKMRN